MSKNYRKSKLTHYGKNNAHGIIVTVEVMSYQAELTESELDAVQDYLTDQAMYAISSAPFTKAPLNRIEVKRPRQ